MKNRLVVDIEAWEGFKINQLLQNAVGGKINKKSSQGLAWDLINTFFIDVNIEIRSYLW